MSDGSDPVESPTGPIDAELLEILVCPKTRAELELVDLPPALQQSLVEKYQEYFTEEEARVTHGLYCAESELVYPIVSEIPIMLVDEALPASAIGR